MQKAARLRDPDLRNLLPFSAETILVFGNEDRAGQDAGGDLDLLYRIARRDTRRMR
jgi:hypothetical protein